MNSTHRESAAATDAFRFHVDLANDWERRFLAQRLGVSEEALRAAAVNDDVTVEQIFDNFCPPPGAAARSHAELHHECIAASLSGVQD